MGNTIILFLYIFLIIGDNLLHALEKDSAVLKKLDKFYLSQAILAAIIVNPGDGKPDNCILAFLFFYCDFRSDLMEISLKRYLRAKTHIGLCVQIMTMHLSLLLPNNLSQQISKGYLIFMSFRYVVVYFISSISPCISGRLCSILI